MQMAGMMVVETAWAEVAGMVCNLVSHLAVQVVGVLVDYLVEALESSQGAWLDGKKVFAMEVQWVVESADKKDTLMALVEAAVKVELMGAWWDVARGKMMVCEMVDLKVVKRGTKKDHWWDLTWGEIVR